MPTYLEHWTLVIKATLVYLNQKLEEFFKKRKKVEKTVTKRLKQKIKKNSGIIICRNVVKANLVNDYIN